MKHEKLKQKQIDISCGITESGFTKDEASQPKQEDINLKTRKR